MHGRAGDQWPPLVATVTALPVWERHPRDAGPPPPQADDERVDEQAGPRIAMETQNDQRLHDLAGKLSSIRQVTTDIYTHASDQGILDTATETFGTALGSIRGSAARLARAAQAGHPVVRSAAVALAIIFLIYFLTRFF